jgi:hypothetical protein
MRGGVEREILVNLQGECLLMSSARKQILVLANAMLIYRDLKAGRTSKIYKKRRVHYTC